MSSPNPNDCTQLATGEVISNEYNDPTYGIRGDPDLPVIAYKVPRSKIAVGSYGQDMGDADIGRPLYVESFLERRLAEDTALRDIAAQNRSLARYASEANFSTTGGDPRGHSFSTRGVR